jgi:hypothetical protein
MKRFALVCMLGVCTPNAFAARPFVTDDARLTTAGSCQLESWVRVYRDSREIWALPACNPFGNFEITAGGGYARNDGSQGTDDYVLQAKTLFRPLETNGWGFGLGVGTVRHPKISPGPNLLGNTYAYLPVSFSFDDDRLIVHTNVGWLRDRASNNNNMTWGIGGEFQASPRFLLIAETFGDHRNQPYWQIGGRYSIVPNRVQVDTTVGQQLTGPVSSRWLSFGLRLTPESLF